MKRRPELHGLSEQHHHGLIAARDLRLAAEGERPLERSVEAFLAAWASEIQPHFRAEEEVLLPEFARVSAPDDPLVIRTLSDHIALRRDVRELARLWGQGVDAVSNEAADLCTRLAAALEAHIRFEERVLFPAIEAAMGEELLGEIADDLPQKLPRGSCRVEAPAMPGAGPSAHG